MCDYCKDILLVDRIQSPKHYEQIVESIVELVCEKGFLLVEGTCPLGCHQSNHMWVDDIIYHIVKCSRCNQEFTCVVNAYRGGGCFKKAKKAVSVEIYQSFSIAPSVSFGLSKIVIFYLLQ